MNRLIALMTCAVSLGAAAQSPIVYPFNPDANSDGFVGVSDILEGVATYDNPFSPGEIMVGDTALADWIDLIYSTIQAQQTTIDSLLNISQNSNDLADYWLPVLTGNEICPSSTLTYFGETYDLVAFQGQCWLAQSLRTENFRNGDPIPNIEDVDPYTESFFAYPNGTPENKLTHGLLYNSGAIRDARAICPAGFKPVTSGSWQSMQNLNGIDNSTNDVISNPAGSETNSGLQITFSGRWENTYNGFDTHAWLSSYIHPYTSTPNTVAGIYSITTNSEGGHSWINWPSTVTQTIDFAGSVYCRCNIGPL